MKHTRGLRILLAEEPGKGGDRSEKSSLINDNFVFYSDGLLPYKSWETSLLPGDLNSDHPCNITRGKVTHD